MTEVTETRLEVADGGSTLKLMTNIESVVKKEEEVKVKSECLACALPSEECCDVYRTTTRVSGTSLYVFICNFTNVDIATKRNIPKYLCKTCTNLINILEQAEQKYMALKRDFELIISKNPLFELQTTQTVNLNLVKNETFDYVYEDASEIQQDDSEDEPLAFTKKKKRSTKPRQCKKKKDSKMDKNIASNKGRSCECATCVDGGDCSRSTLLTEGQTSGPENLDMFPLNGAEIKLEVEIEEQPSPLLEERPRQPKLRGQSRSNPRRTNKVMHECDHCHSRFSSLVRLERHRATHVRPKPPYICEVCGAKYKNRRACDIHIAMHNGVSDWKCVLCDKLFPSKGALKRHDNIHTGQPNYQCDLCGKSFIHTSSFKMHKLAHSGVKPHACSVCGLQLMTSSHLKRHLRVHSGEKRFECAACGKRFSERYNLVAHSKSHSGEEVKEAPPRKSHFRCHFCPERFERRYMLERHCTNEHGRTLERPPTRPRNTMSKLLKAQAAARQNTEVEGAPAEGKVKRGESPVTAATHTDKQPHTPTGDVWAEPFTAQLPRLHQYLTGRPSEA